MYGCVSCDSIVTMACAAVDRHGAAIAQGLVVSIHGLYGGRAPLFALERWVGARSSFEVQSFRYRPRQQDLATSGEQLAEFLQLRKPHTVDDSVHFVTFGYGSLVLREAFRYVDWNYTRSKVIMIAPPNRGARYFKSMKKHVGIAGYGGVAADELAELSALDLDTRLGKLPRRCYPLIFAGSLCLNPFNQGNYPNDGQLMVEETTLPGEYRHQIVSATHYTLPVHPTTLWYTTSFLNA